MALVNSMTKEGLETEKVNDLHASQMEVVFPLQTIKWKLNLTKVFKTPGRDQKQILS